MIVVEYFVVGFVVVVFVGPSQLWEEELFHPLTGQVNLEFRIRLQGVSKKRINF